VSDSTPAPPTRDLEELIAQFEDAVRKRPTPTEIAEAEGTEVSIGAVTLPTSRQRQRRPELRAQPESGMKPKSGPGPEAAPKPASQVAAKREPEPDRELELALEPGPSAAPAPSAPAPAPSAPASSAERIEDLQTWWAGGERVEVETLSGARYSIFTRVLGEGPWITLIHGFPTSSWDWAPIAPTLAKRYRLLTFDLLGFGDSDKPSGHDWSAFEQADIVAALWRHFGVEETRVVAHDVGMTVALELLARQGEGQLATRVSDYTLLNGGVYAGFHRPRPVQVWLQRPVIGSLIARVLSENRFGHAFSEIFGPEHQPTAEELRQHWESVARRGGSKNYHRLIKYIPERRAHAARWEAAVQQSEMPIRFVWGMADPVSGAHMAEVIKERRPGADIVELADVGHYPQLEAPDRVAAAIMESSPRKAADTRPASAKVAGETNEAK
jgi:pimeloyl-ACP methyl ester carboxylesterase